MIIPGRTNCRNIDKKMVKRRFWCPNGVFRREYRLLTPTSTLFAVQFQATEKLVSLFKNKPYKIWAVCPRSPIGLSAGLRSQRLWVRIPPGTVPYRPLLDEISRIRLLDVVMPTRGGEIRRRCISQPTDHQARCPRTMFLLTVVVGTETIVMRRNQSATDRLSCR